MASTYVIVIRNRITQKQIVLEVNRSGRIIPYVYKALKKNGWIKENKTFPKEAESFIIENYKKIPSRQIAEDLQKKFKIPATKNSVIGRYHTIIANRKKVLHQSSEPK